MEFEQSHYHIGELSLEAGWPWQAAGGSGNDFEELAAFFRPVAEGGDARAQFQLGRLYSRVAHDDQEALRWYRRAADGGDFSAQMELAEMYLAGKGVARDACVAMAWLWRAASRGHAPALQHLGAMYEMGLGVAVDFVEACRWYLLASVEGSDSAAEQLASLMTRLSPSQSLEVRELTEAFAANRNVKRIRPLSPTD